MFARVRSKLLRPFCMFKIIQVFSLCSLVCLVLIVLIVDSAQLECKHHPSYIHVKKSDGGIRLMSWYVTCTWYIMNCCLTEIYQV
jgi:hypothetical protein